MLEDPTPSTETVDFDATDGVSATRWLDETGNEIDDETDETDETDGIDETDETDDIDETDDKDATDTDETDGVDETDDTDALEVEGLAPGPVGHRHCENPCR